MVEYVIGHNPDDRVIQRAAAHLKKGELICAPTDTNWVLLADAFNKDAVSKLYQIKKEGPQKHFSLLVSEISMASEVAIIDDAAFKLIKRAIPGHYTFIFEATKKMVKSLKASKQDKEVGLRFVPSVLINRLIETFGGPLISANAPESVKSDGMDEVYSYMIEEKLGHILAMIIDPGELEFAGTSTIVNFTGDQVEIDRVGAGETGYFV